MTRIRVIHSQTTQGPLLLNDVEDGLPRENFAYLYKQQVYIPRVDPVDPSIPGFTDLVPTGKVLSSVDGGVIAGLQSAGYCLAPILYDDTDTVAPAISAAVISGALTITGTNMLSLAPVLTQVVITGDGAVTLNENQILTAGGTVSETSIVVPATLIPGVSDTSSSAQVVADRQNSNVEVIST